jgi:hypothetical protein
VISGGGTSWSVGTLAAGATSSHDWVVKGTADSIASFNATAQALAYGETFTAAAAPAALKIDSTPPAVAITCPGGSTTSTGLPVTWRGTDLSGVATLDVLVATDGGAFLPWLTNTARSMETFVGQPGHTYRFAVRATDGLGNASAEVACDTTLIQASNGQATLPPPPTVGKPLPVAPRLRISSAKVSGTRLVASGRLAAGATGTVRLSYTARGHTVRTSASVRHGRFRLRLRLNRALRRASRGVLRLSYSGDAHHAPQRVTRHIRR